ncbi:TetR/AcrR family transcriptional regulator [Rhodococcus sp. BP-252]|uniref:TetR/AcrR family transcriptional regulator n=1 Tax=unclassified Rhodococcus (in: high G+C Gram-positive bacteria) TaxID=192944 RepID=UPI001C9A5E43|nr:MULTISPECIES: TetR/AcrR family transcriptional regulator [unclassified Rhodococcus (in: high G+C Gram-positive bacteria)]MBY6414440.1 TetR/AcrR family transcriptional regulator [Rhodococcus sp. BP-320]MBY6419157.1 TetR/AcrR family transcriptional regulator [Rhodococcus sp. BP-321]MBY6424001.1 TetR/AcrR family transcriptional regulator [Rhodococcus sp. BP-324]MBY6429288.1 TetR/AcrR family transcriptional regulator [Rhodococcus sp. BP-323]MBY6434249.1 TetR/AcrR family transcriptional regulato
MNEGYDMMTIGTAHRADDDWRVYRPLPLTPILAAALSLFQAKGYHGTTIRDIAARAEITMPSLYYHYGNKEGILAALLNVGMDDLAAHIAGALSEAGESTTERLRHFVTAVSLHETCRRDIARIHPESRFLGPEARSHYVARRNTVTDNMIELLETGRAEGVFQIDDTHFIARSIFAMLQGTPQWYRDDGPDDPHDIAAKYVQSIFRMITDSV